MLIALLIGSTLLALLGTERFFLRDDLQDQYLGGYAEVARAWSAGEVPLISSLSWQSAALAGEYQYGVFSPFLTACNLALFGAGLPLWSIAALLVLVHLIVLGCGAYVLARSERLAPPLALMVALAGSINGWIMVWGVNWFPALASFAWVPWAWWGLKCALERRDERWPVPAAGIFVALIVTAGWPYSCLMIALVAAMLAAKSMRREQSLLAPARAVLGGMIGLGLSAPAWLMLVEYSRVTLRGQTSSPLSVQTDFLVPLKAYLATIVPTLQAAWNTPWQASGAESLVMHVGLAPAVLPVAAMLALGSGWVRERAEEILFLLLLCFLATYPSLGIFKWSFRWLPLLFLQLALIAGHAGLRLLDHDGRRRGGGIALALTLLVIGLQLLSGGRPRDEVLWLWLGLVAVAATWFAVESRPRWRRVHPHLPWLVTWATSILIFAVGFQGFQYDLWHRRVEARTDRVFDPEITYLALYSQAGYSSAAIRYPGQRYYPGNEHMHAGLRFVNGYSPMGPAGSTRLFGFNYVGALSAEDPGARPLGPVLRRMAVDGLVTWDDSGVERNIPWEDFEPYAAELGALIHRRRSGPTPRVQVVRKVLLASFPESAWQQRTSPWPLLETRLLLETRSLLAAAPSALPETPRTADFGDAELTLLAEERLRVIVDVDARQSTLPVLVCFARPWLPGYRVALDGRSAEMGRLDGIQPAVEVPAGRMTRVELTYRPASLRWGLVLATVTALGLLVALADAVRRHRGREAE